MTKEDLKEVKIKEEDSRVHFRRPNGTVRVVTVFDPQKEHHKSKTVQSDAAETDINLIIERAIRGNLVMTNQREPRYGDFSSGFDFAETKRKVAEFESKFEQLPSKVRARFDNDPAQLVEFASNPENKDEAISLGILPKDLVPVAPENPAPVGAPVAPVAPAAGSAPAKPV